MDEKRSILVTGGSGLIGRHAVRALCERGHSVHVVGRGARSSVIDERAQYIQTDMLDTGSRALIAAKANADTLLHLAWETTHGAFWTSPNNLDWLSASLTLMQAFTEAGGRHIIGAGTCVEYAPPERGPCIAGKTPLAPKNLYATSKDAFRRVAETWCAQNGLRFAWGRVFLLTGEGEAHARLIPSIIRSLVAEEEARCSSGKQVRDFMDARDCGAAFASLALGDFQGSINIATGEPVSIGGIAEQIGALMGRPDLVRLGALPDRPGDPPNLWGDASALAALPGYRRRYDHAAMLRDAIAHFG